MAEERIVETKEDIKEVQKDFSADYIHSLREEAAGWRRKYRDLQVGTQALEVKAVLNRRGIQADPEWIKIEDGQSIDLAIENFLSKHPNLTPEKGMGGPSIGDDPISQIIQKKVEVKKAPAPKMPDSSSYGHESKTPQENLRNRQIDEIKKDPEARALLRKEYRSMLSTQGHRNPEY